MSVPVYAVWVVRGSTSWGEERGRTLEGSPGPFPLQGPSDRQSLETRQGRRGGVDGGRLTVTEGRDWWKGRGLGTREAETVPDPDLGRLPGGHPDSNRPTGAGREERVTVPIPSPSRVVD